MENRASEVLIIVGDAVETMDTLYPVFRPGKTALCGLWPVRTADATRWCSTKYPTAGDRGQMPVRPGSLRRYLRERALRHRWQPGQ